MKSKMYLGFLFPLFFAACASDTTNTITSENDVDAARNFVNAALQGNYDQAKTFMLPDSVNNEYLEAFERNFREHMPPDDKRGYREASINIHDVSPINDSATVVHYSNSFKKKRDSLLVVRSGGQWLVDLKYSFVPKNDAP